MGLRDKTTPTLTTPLIRANMSSMVATIFSSLAFLSLSISMANLSRLVAASFSSLVLLSSSVSKAYLSCLLATIFSSLRYLSNSFSLPRFNLLRFLWFSVLLLTRLILGLSFLCLQSLKLSLRLCILAHDRHADRPTYIYHPKSRLNTPVWGSLRSPNN